MSYECSFHWDTSHLHLMFLLNRCFNSLGYLSLMGKCDLIVCVFQLVVPTEFEVGLGWAVQQRCVSDAGTPTAPETDLSRQVIHVWNVRGSQSKLRQPATVSVTFGFECAGTRVGPKCRANE